MDRGNARPGKEAVVRAVRSVLPAALWLLALGCSHTITVKHQVEPIYITVQVNIQVQQQLNEFFDFEEDVEETKPEGGSQ